MFFPEHCFFENEYFSKFNCFIILLSNIVYLYINIIVIYYICGTDLRWTWKIWLRFDMLIAQYYCLVKRLYSHMAINAAWYCMNKQCVMNSQPDAISLHLRNTGLYIHNWNRQWEECLVSEFWIRDFNEFNQIRGKNY